MEALDGGATHEHEREREHECDRSHSYTTASTERDGKTPSNGLYAPANPLEPYRPGTGVSVERAEADFAALNRALSQSSQNGQCLSRSASGKPGGLVDQDPDVEKVATGSREPQAGCFDLEATLRGARALDEEHDIKTKRIGVLWEGLTVSGVGGLKNTIKTFPDAFVGFFNVPGTVMRLCGYGKKGRRWQILRRFRGVAKPGEMVLVLGKPSSGCTTFLKVIANQRFGYTCVDGEVLYGPYDARTFAKRFRGEVRAPSAARGGLGSDHL
jgi:hypothetical protein